MIAGYIRLSPLTPSEEVQRGSLEQWGCQSGWIDVATTRSDERPALEQCLVSLSRGDMLVVHSLEILGRSLNELISIIDNLNARGIFVRSVSEDLLTTNPATREVFEALAKMEFKLRSDRSYYYLHKARKQGRPGGRVRALNDDQVLAARRDHESGMGLTELANRYDVSYNTIKAAIRGTGIYAKDVRTPSNATGERNTPVSVKENNVGSTTEPRGSLGRPGSGENQ